MASLSVHHPDDNRRNPKKRKQPSTRGTYVTVIEAMNYPEDRFRQMIDEIPTLAWSCLPDGTGEFLNKQWLEYAGLSMEAALGWKWKSVVHPDDLERLMDTWQRHLASGEPGEVEARLRRFDGEYRWFLFRAVPIRDENNNVIRWYGTNTDQAVD